MRLQKYLLFNESKNLKNYIKSMLFLFNKQDVNAKQLAFYEWMDKQAKTVKVKSYKSDPTLQALIDENLDFTTPKIKECYRNSWMVASQASKQIDVIGGYTAAMGIPIEHAWNFYKPKKLYFDLTAELCLNKRVESEEYLQIIKLKANEATKILSSGMFPVSGMMGTYYFKFKK